MGIPVLLMNFDFKKEYLFFKTIIAAFISINTIKQSPRQTYTRDKVGN